MTLKSMHFRSIATRLIQRIIWLAVGCLALLGGLHAWIDYRQGQQEFARSMNQLADNSQRVLSTALWDIDPPVVHEQVRWIASLPEVQYVQVIAKNSDERFASDKGHPQSPPAVTVPLMAPNGQNIQLGVLEIWPNPQYFLELMLRSTAKVLLGYVVFTVLICLLVAWVMRRELRQPLSHIAGFAAALKPNELGTPLQMQRPQRKEADEIDLVIYGFQQLQTDLHRYIDNLDDLVAKRTQQLEALVEEVKGLSLVDALTGCFNRRAMDDRLPAELERSKRYGRPLSVIFVDIDHFKAVNDNHGHSAGDMVLREVALRLQEQLRSQVDWVVRYGGEEFMVVLPETGSAEALNVALRLAAHIRSKAVALPEKALSVTASFGVAQLKEDDTISSMLGRADAMLYVAKSEGRDCVRMAP